jgi:hypothetical protein
MSAIEWFFHNWLCETIRTCPCVMVVLWNRHNGHKSVICALMDVSTIAGYIWDLAEGHRFSCIYPRFPWHVKTLGVYIETRRWLYQTMLYRVQLTWIQVCLNSCKLHLVLLCYMFWPVHTAIFRWKDVKRIPDGGGSVHESQRYKKSVVIGGCFSYTWCSSFGW